MDIRKVAGLGSPARSYNFEVLLPKDFGDSERLRYRVLEVRLPFLVSFHKEAIPISPSFSISTLTEAEYGETCDISFWEDEQFTVTKYFEKWVERIINLDRSSPFFGMFYRKKNYARDILVLLLDGKGKVLREIVLEKAYPVEVSPYQLSYNESEAVRFDVKFSFSGIRLK